jgi:hypothetical protein
MNCRRVRAHATALQYFRLRRRAVWGMRRFAAGSIYASGCGEVRYPNDHPSAPYWYDHEGSRVGKRTSASNRRLSICDATIRDEQLEAIAAGLGDERVTI